MVRNISTDKIGQGTLHKVHDMTQVQQLSINTMPQVQDVLVR